MMMPLSTKLQACLRQYHREPVFVDEVTINLHDGECPEYMADELMLWCHQNGLRARRMDRSRLDIVRFGFVDAEAAAQFRDACGLPPR